VRRQAPDHLNRCTQREVGIVETASNEGRQIPQILPGSVELGASLEDDRIAFQNT
jgi:hypothetical protein